MKSQIDPVRRGLFDALADRTVLVFGPLGNYAGFRDVKEMWDFHYLTTIARRVVGVDLDEAACQLARADGYEVLHGNAESYELDMRFNAVLAIDVIEHVSNPLRFFQNAERHLLDGGRLIVETPNPWAAEVSARSLVRGPQVNPDHVNWMDASNLRELSRRAAMKVDAITHYTPLNQFNMSMRLRTHAYRALGHLRPHWHSKVVLSARR